MLVLLISSHISPLRSLVKMGKKKPSKAQKEEVARKRYFAPIWKEMEECMAELRDEEEAERMKKEAEEDRAVEWLKANKEEPEARIQEMFEEECKKKA